MGTHKQIKKHKWSEQNNEKISARYLHDSKENRTAATQYNLSYITDYTILPSCLCTLRKKTACTFPDAYSATEIQIRYLPISNWNCNLWFNNVFQPYDCLSFILCPLCFHTAGWLPGTASGQLKTLFPAILDDFFLARSSSSSYPVLVFKVLRLSWTPG